MQSKRQFCNSLSHIISCAATVALAIATVLALTVILTPSAQAQTFTVLHTFTGGADGGQPAAGLTMDQAGNFYAPSPSDGNGLVFGLSKKGSSWIFNPLYYFLGGDDGSAAYAGVVFGPDGSLYGTTYFGGGNRIATQGVARFSSLNRIQQPAKPRSVAGRRP